MSGDGGARVPPAPAQLTIRHKHARTHHTTHTRLELKCDDDDHTHTHTQPGEMCVSALGTVQFATRCSDVVVVVGTIIIIITITDTGIIASFCARALNEPRKRSRLRLGSRMRMENVLHMFAVLSRMACKVRTHHKYARFMCAARASAVAG